MEHFAWRYLEQTRPQDSELSVLNIVYNNQENYFKKASSLIIHRIINTSAENWLWHACIHYTQ